MKNVSANVCLAFVFVGIGSCKQRTFSESGVKSESEIRGGVVGVCKLSCPESSPVFEEKSQKFECQLERMKGLAMNANGSLPRCLGLNVEWVSGESTGGGEASGLTYRCNVEIPNGTGARVDQYALTDISAEGGTAVWKTFVNLDPQGSSGSYKSVVEKVVMARCPNCFSVVLRTDGLSGPGSKHWVKFSVAEDPVKKEITAIGFEYKTSGNGPTEWTELTDKTGTCTLSSPR